MYQQTNNVLLTYSSPNQTRYVDGTPTSEVTPVTIWYIRPPHHGHNSQYHGHEWMTHILFVPCQSAAPFLRYSNFRLWPWNSKVKVMGVVKGQCRTVGPVSYQLTSFSFHINQTNNSWDTAISKFDLETSKVKVMSEVKGQGQTLYPVSNRCVSFSFHINRINNSWDRAKIVIDLEKTHPNFLKKFAKITVFGRSAPKSNQVITMTRAIKLLRFVVQWVVLTLSHRQANLSLSMPQPWPWVEVMERSSSTSPQTPIIFVPNI